MWQLWVVLTFILLAYYLKFYAHYKKYAKFYNLPGPMRLPFVGHGYLFLRKKMYKAFEEILEKVGLPCLLYLPEPHYCTSDPKEIKILLNHPNAISKSEIYSYLEIVFGNGLIFTPAHLWKPKRKILSRAFNRGLLNSFIPIFYKNSCVFKESLLENPDFYTLFKILSISNFLETAGGASLNDKKRAVDAISEGQEILINRATTPILRYDFIYKRTKKAKLIFSYMEEFRAIIMDNAKEKWLNNQKVVDSSSDLPFFDILYMLNKEGKYNEDEVFQEVSTFVSAGTDTTGHTLAFACVLLGMHPHIQEKVFEEVISVVGPNKEIQYTDLPNLKYTEMVILETLRMFPTIPMLGRKTDADIDIGRCVIPSGSNIYILIMHLHRNEKYYPNPTEFDPDRFLPEEIKNRDPSTFMAFSIGARNCIGWLYALMMMKVTIANLVRDYKISSKHKSVTEFNIESNVVMRIDPHPDCRFEKR